MNALQPRRQQVLRASGLSVDSRIWIIMHACSSSSCIKKKKKKKYDCGCWSCPLWRGFTRTLRLGARLKTYYRRLHSSLYIMYSEFASVGCRDSGSCGFLISPSVLYLSEALSEGQNHIRPNEKAIVDPFLHLVPPDSFSPRKHLSLCAAGGLWDYQGTPVSWGKFLLSLKLYYSAQGHDSQCFWKRF